MLFLKTSKTETLGMSFIRNQTFHSLFQMMNFNFTNMQDNSTDYDYHMYKDKDTFVLQSDSDIQWQRIYAILTPIIVIFGVCGNIGCTLILSLSSLRFLSVSVFLTASVVSDTFFLSGLLCMWMSTIGVAVSSPIQWCQFLSMLTNPSNFLSTWFSVTVIIDQCLNWTRSLICSPAQAKICVLSITSIAVVVFVNLTLIMDAQMFGDSIVCLPLLSKMHAFQVLYKVDLLVNIIIPLLICICIVIVSCHHAVKSKDLCPSRRDHNRHHHYIGAVIVVENTQNECQHQLQHHHRPTATSDNTNHHHQHCQQHHHHPATATASDNSRTHHHQDQHRQHQQQYLSATTTVKHSNSNHHQQKQQHHPTNTTARNNINHHLHHHQQQHHITTTTTIGTNHQHQELQEQQHHNLETNTTHNNTRLHDASVNDANNTRWFTTTTTTTANDSSNRYTTRNILTMMLLLQCLPLPYNVLRAVHTSRELLGWQYYVTDSDHLMQNIMQYVYNIFFTIKGYLLLIFWKDYRLRTIKILRQICCFIFRNSKLWPRPHRFLAIWQKSSQVTFVPVSSSDILHDIT